MNVFWIKNPDGGKPDTMLTLGVIAFTVIIIKVLIGGVTIKIFGTPYTLSPIDAGTIGALLVPTLGAYVGRRYTDRKFVDVNNNGIDDSEEQKKA